MLFLSVKKVPRGLIPIETLRSRTASVALDRDTLSQRPQQALQLDTLTMASSKVAFESTTTATSEDGSAPAPTVPKLSDRFADESYKLLSQIKVDPPTPEQAERIRKKCVRWVIPFICLGYHLMYVDKQTVSMPRDIDISCEWLLTSL